MRSRRWLGFLLVTVAGEAVLAVTIRLQELQLFLAGDRHAPAVTGVIGLVWLPLLLVAAFGLARALADARQRATGDARALTDVAGTSHEWVWAADTELRLTYSNDRVQELLGYQPAELYGRPLLSLLAADQERRAKEVLAAALAGGSGWDDLEFGWVHQDGHVVALQGTAVPVRDASGVIVGFRGTRRLVTSAMTSERSLLAARHRINEALDGQTLDIALQPIVSLLDGRLVGAEALARFPDGRAPDRWFAEARETAQNLALDLLAFRTALQLLPVMPHDSYLSINASPELIMDPALQSLLLDGGVPLERVVIEVTEHVAIHSYDEIHTALAPLRERGVRLAVDDTGAGYASLTHVLQLRPDIIKVDRSLIAKVTSDPARRSLVTALVLLALDLDASVTAEGVETPSELETLGALGVDHVQGYLLARPTTDTGRWQPWWTRNWLYPADKTSVSSTVR